MLSYLCNICILFYLKFLSITENDLIGLVLNLLITTLEQNHILQQIYAEIGLSNI